MMRKSINGFFALLVCCCAVHAAEEPSVKQVIKEKVEEINNALIKEDYAKVVDLTYPGVVKLMGGREKMTALLESGMKDLSAKGFEIRSAKVSDPPDPVEAGSELYVVVPFVLEMKTPGGKLTQKSYVIGVSPDKGKLWTFVNGDVDPKAVKQVLPKLPSSLKLPEKQKPVLEKE